MAKRQRKKIQKGRFRYRSGERSELKGSAVVGQRYDKDFARMVAFAAVRKPAVGYLSEARQHVFNLQKAEKDAKYVARFKGTSAGVHEIKVRHDEIIGKFKDDQWVDLYSSSTVCIKLFWEDGGQAFLVKYMAVSMTRQKSVMYGSPARAKREFTEGRIRWEDPEPMIIE